MRRYLAIAALGGFLLTGCGPAMRPESRRPAPAPAPRVAPVPSPSTAPNIPTTPGARGITPGATAPGTTVPGTNVPGSTTAPDTLTPSTTTPGRTPTPPPTQQSLFPPLGTNNAARARTAAQAANNTPGVGVAYALVSGNTTVVGVRSDGRSPAGRNLEMAVASAVRATDPTLTNVYVTTRHNVVESMRLIDANASRGLNTAQIDDQMRGIIAYLHANPVEVTR